MPANAYPVKNADRIYVIEMFFTALLYIAAAKGRPWLIAHAGSPELATLATLVPAIPVWLMGLVVWRFYRHIDEYRQKRFLEVLSLTFGIGVCIIVTIDALYPKTSFDWAWPVLGVTWAIIGGLHELVRR
jgi:hypothetical protein